MTCAQDFTRKYSAYRHNRILHQERGKIVRTLEYVIGRVTGEYSSVDPVLFRRKNRQGTAIGSHGNFPFTAIAHSSPDSQSYENIGQKEYKSTKQSQDKSTTTYSADQSKDSSSSKLEVIKSLCKSLIPHPLHETLIRRIELDVIKSKNKESRLDEYLQPLLLYEEALRLQSNSQSFAEPIKEKGFLSRHPKLYDLYQPARDKLKEIEQLMSPSNHPKIVWDEIERLADAFKITGDFKILNFALDFLKRNV
ncbi:MAG: hypothetical protein ACRD47_06725 [Nitrososphaeraceae archaeon]